MRIAMGVPSLGFYGGIERHAHDLAASLAARGHRLTLLHGRGEGKDPDAYARPFERVARAEDARSLRGDLDLVYVHRANDAAELEVYDGVPVVVATHDHDLTCVRSHRYVPVGLEPCHRAPGVACVTHGCVVVRDRRAEARLPIALRSPFALRARLHRLAARAPLVACSRYVARNVVNAGVAPSRVHVVHPLPPEDERPVVPRPREPRLAVAGNLLRGKGVDIAIRALEHLPREVTLTIAGDGPSRAELEQLAREVDSGRVRFTGYVPPERVADVYDEASVVLVPSRWPEPFGMVGIEAMRRGRPVVGAGHGGIPEWLLPESGGRLFAPGDARSLADGAARLLADDGAGERARRFAMTTFPHRRLVAEIEALFARVLGEASS